MSKGRRHRQRATPKTSRGSRAPVAREQAERHAVVNAMKGNAVKAAGNQMVQLQASMSDAASLLVRPAQQATPHLTAGGTKTAGKDCAQ